MRRTPRPDPPRAPSRPPLLIALPALFSRPGPLGTAANLASLLMLGIVGAAATHLAAYHLRANSAGLYLVEHCPWRPVLLVVALIGLSNGLLLRREVAALWREQRTLAARLTLQVPAGAFTTLPRRPVRLAVLSLFLYAIELAATSPAAHIAPMQIPSMMGGHQMLMAVSPLLPLPLGQALAAAVMGTLLWRLERRATALRQIAIVLRRLLALLLTPALRSVPLPIATLRPPRLLHGFAIFSRPPPPRGQQGHPPATGEPMSRTCTAAASARSMR